MKEFKQSNFNIIIPYEGKMIIYNTFTQAIAALGENEFYEFNNHIQGDVFEKSKKLGFFTNSDEIQILKDKYYNSNGSKYLKLTVLLTTACNARCPYCYEKGIENETMTPKNADLLIDFIKRTIGARTLKITWFGGEPFLNQEIISYICKRLKDEGIVYSTYAITNGSLLRDIPDESLSLWRLTGCQVTIDGVGSTYNLIKNYCSNEQNPFETVMAGIEKTISRKISVNIRVNYYPNRYESAIEVIEYMHRRFGDNEFLSLYVANVSDKNSPLPIELDKNPLIDIYESLLKNGFAKNLSDLGLGISNHYCGIVDNDYLVISPNGDIFKCEHVVKNSSERIGNIVDGITAQDVSKWTQMMPYNNQKCLSCKALPYCQGGCRALYLFDKENSNCSQSVNCLEQIILLYYKYKKCIL